MAAVRPPARFHRGWIHWVMYTLGGGIMAELWLPAEKQTQKRGCKKHFHFTWPVISSKFSLCSQKPGVNCLWLSVRPTVCRVQASDRIDVICVQMRESLAYSTSALAFSSMKLLFLSVMRISCYEVRFYGLCTNFKVGPLHMGLCSKYHEKQLQLICCPTWIINKTLSRRL